MSSGWNGSTASTSHSHAELLSMHCTGTSPPKRKRLSAGLPSPHSIAPSSSSLDVGQHDIPVDYYKYKLPTSSKVSSLLMVSHDGSDDDGFSFGRVPSTVAHAISLLVRKIGVGIVGAVYAGMVLTVVMVLAVVLGVGLVQMWVEEPVFVRQSLYFDYTHPHPYAVFSFGAERRGCHRRWREQKMGGVPVGHTFYVSLVLLLPDSDYNREIGVFQLTTELISNTGERISKSSQPCMLRFRSLPIRLMRTFLIGMPLLLGLTAETQKMIIPMLKHKEGYPRTEVVRISMIPRAGTTFVPQLYEAEIVITSQLPWSKEVVHNWKWTFYVWTSLYIYIMLIIIIVCCFKPLIFPMLTSPSEHYYRGDQQDLTTLEVSKEPQEERAREEREISEKLRRRRRSRSKRKAMFFHGTWPDTVGSSASSMSITREETPAATEDDAGDTESVCFGG